MEQEKNASKKVSKKVMALSGGILILCFVVLFPIAVYMRYTTSPWAQKLSATFQFPACIVWSPFSVFSTGELQADVRSLRKFYEGQDFSSVGMRIDFTTEDGKKRLLVRERGILNKNIEDLVIENIVRDAGVRVTDTEIDQSVTRKLHEFGTEDRVKNDLSRLYGWSLEDFKTKVVKPELYKEKARELFDARSEKTKDTVASATIQEALSQLNSGMSFADSVKKYSEGATVENGGDLGWVNLSQTEPNIATAISALKVGERSGSIETSLGYHIVKLTDIREESGTTLYHVSQIITRKEAFSDWVNGFIKSAPVWIFLPDYQWNAKTGFVEFSNPVMTEFEAKSVSVEAVSATPGESGTPSS